jgi:hypothetical protein
VFAGSTFFYFVGNSTNFCNQRQGRLQRRRRGNILVHFSFFFVLMENITPPK